MSLGKYAMGIACWVLMQTGLIAQTNSQNIVPNSSFEQYSSAPLGWFYTGKDFTQVVKYWESPTAASPDVYGPNVFVPSDWRRQGFGDAKAHTGESMAGITVFGCEGGKPHCREYVQVQLVEALVPGQRYAVSYWVKHLRASMRIREICMAFAKERIYTNLDEPLLIETDIVPGYILKSPAGDWIQVTSEFVASDDENYLLIGNFLDDAHTTSEKCESVEPLGFGYYYVDDIAITKLPPILEVPVKPDDLVHAELETGRTVRLYNIYFDYDRDDFLPRSYKELGTLVTIMKENPSMSIEVRGHTDNTGDKDYNNQLSLSRARAVTNYLIDHGIESYRLKSRGFGSSSPVATNETEAGRQENRRVEFLILSK